MCANEWGAGGVGPGEAELVAGDRRGTEGSSQRLWFNGQAAEARGSSSQMAIWGRQSEIAYRKVGSRLTVQSYGLAEDQAANQEKLYGKSKTDERECKADDSDRVS